MSKIVERKYVVIGNIITRKLQIGVTVKDRYHRDIFGDPLPRGWDVWSAGYYTYDTKDVAGTLKTHGRSIGYQIGPSSGDEIMLKAFEEEGEIEFDLDEIRALRREELGV